MCRSESDPNGPYRCSADMENALLACRSHYKQAVQNESRMRANVETLTAEKEIFEQLAEEHPENPSLQARLEDIEQLEIDAQKEHARALARQRAERERLIAAQKNFDSTRRGMQNLSSDYNNLGAKLQDEDLSDEARERIEQQMADIKERFETANGTLLDERKEPLAAEAEREGATEGIEYSMVDNTEEGEKVTPTDGSEVLDEEPMNAALDRMIDDLDLSAVSKKYKGMIDPDTGEMYDEHEIQVISRRQRREARERLRRIRVEEGDKRELMKDFLRSAMYRALRYNKDTRKIMRLVGLKHFNDFLGVVDNYQAEHKDKKIAKLNDKWLNRREKVAERELADIDKSLEKEQDKYDAKVNRLTNLRESNGISDETFNYRVSEEKKKYDAATGKLRTEKANVELTKASWAQEDMDRQRREDAHDQQIREAMEETRRRKEQIAAAEFQAQV